MALECEPHHKMLLTDQKEMLDLMRCNIHLNQVEHRAEAMMLNWYVAPRRGHTSSQGVRNMASRLTRGFTRSQG